MSARYQNPEMSRWISADPAAAFLVNPNRKGFSIIESINPYSYVGNNPVKYHDPTGLRLDDDLKTDVKRITSIEVERNALKGENNDTVRIKIGNSTAAVYEGAQSEKNSMSDNQTDESERTKPGVSGGLPDGTLPVGDDYIATLTDGSASYDDAISITSDTAELPGTGKKGIPKAWAFLMHSFSSKFKKQTKGWSLGCQMLPDDSFSELRKDLESLGFENGDSLPLSIKQNNFVERR